MAVKILRRSDEVGLGDFRTELNVLQKVRQHCGCQELAGSKSHRLHPVSRFRGT